MSLILIDLDFALDWFKYQYLIYPVTGLENESCSVLKKCQEPIRKLVWVLADSQPCLHLAHSAGQLSFRPVPHYRTCS